VIFALAGTLGIMKAATTAAIATTLGLVIMVTSLPVPVVEVSARYRSGVRHASQDRTEPFGQLRELCGSFKVTEPFGYNKFDRQMVLGDPSARRIVTG
jgi:hypothetical protein